MKSMKYLFISIVSTIAFFFASCEEDLNVDIPKEDSKLVINSLLGKDSLLRIHVGSSADFNNSASDTGLDNANVQISRDGQVLETLTHTQNGWYNLENHFLTDDGIYKVEVTHQDHETITSETNMLSKVSIIDLNYSLEESNKLTFSLEFKDDSEQSNYYMILLKAINKSTAIDIEYFSDDIVFNGNLSENPIGLQQNMLRGSRTFSDNNSNGNTYSISFYAFDINFDITQLFKEYRVELYHITEDYFKYERSLVSFDNREDLPFYKKVNLHSNVNGGYGIFTSYAIDTKSIRID